MGFQTELKRSRMHAQLLLLSAILGLFAVTMVPAELMWVTLPLWGGCLVLALRQWRLAPNRLLAQPGGLWIGFPKGEMQAVGQLQRRLPFLVLVRLQESVHSPVAIWRDALGEAQWRQLRLLLNAGLIQSSADDHVLAGKIDGHHDGVLGDRR